MKLYLENMTVLVTGAESGIDREINSLFNR